MAEPQQMDQYIELLPPDSFQPRGDDNEQYQQFLQPYSYEPAVENLLPPDGSIGPTSSTYWEAETQSHYPFSLGTSIASDYMMAGWAPPCNVGSTYPWLGAQVDQVDPSQPVQWPIAVEVLPTLNAPRQHPPDNRIEPTSIESGGLLENVTRNTADTMVQEKPTTPQEAPVRNPKAEIARDHVPTASTTPHDVGMIGNEDTEHIEPQKRSPYRVKNRAAAKRCREKTKQYEIDLVAKETQVMQQRVYLVACIRALKNEVLSLRSQILDHGECSCEEIRRYIARTATIISAGDLDDMILPSDDGGIHYLERAVAASIPPYS
ncbi:hypothetical protein CORC01_02884 [Colletotrichum orchidophilum]|uniref:BZIP domain-containing protein n=1 Tax=Colletotrichum orchidophilum TaxID=1209926 RepID=A0A1G4BK53_9PEZI|nr:uncharacterized protein CORC01_02884 [Colletotrichum orchidophilum]OHF01693.1 hypothetical protein CORC01_02884 [Colletotrichum orchidophilum]